jgi:hypothetical protein
MTQAKDWSLTPPSDVAPETACGRFTEDKP